MQSNLDFFAFSLQSNHSNVLSRYLSFKRYNPSKNFDLFARAGFFVTNQGFIKCCACNLERRNWFKINDPLVFHATENPYCNFLRKEFGDVTIFNISQNYVKDWDAETFLCKVCFVNQVNKFLICGHIFCEQCLANVNSCPLCRGYISRNESKSGYHPHLP